ELPPVLAGEARAELTDGRPDLRELGRHCEVHPRRTILTHVTSPNRLRRSCLAVPGTSERALAKAPDLDAAMVFVDLEDAVPAAAKNDDTRARVSRALIEQDWRAATGAGRAEPDEPAGGSEA